MARIIIAVVYIAAILVIGILAGRNVKTSEEFATANRGIPFLDQCVFHVQRLDRRRFYSGLRQYVLCVRCFWFLSGYRRRHWRYVVQPAVCS